MAQQPERAQKSFLPTPLNPNLTEDELRAILTNAGKRVRVVLLLQTAVETTVSLARGIHNHIVTKQNEQEKEKWAKQAFGSFRDSIVHKSVPVQRRQQAPHPQVEYVCMSAVECIFLVQEETMQKRPKGHTKLVTEKVDLTICLFDVNHFPLPDFSIVTTALETLFVGFHMKDVRLTALAKSQEEVVVPLPGFDLNMSPLNLGWLGTKLAVKLGTFYSTYTSYFRALDLLAVAILVVAGCRSNKKVPVLMLWYVALQKILDYILNCITQLRDMKLNFKTSQDREKFKRLVDFVLLCVQQLGSNVSGTERDGQILSSQKVQAQVNSKRTPAALTPAQKQQFILVVKEAESAARSLFSELIASAQQQWRKEQRKKKQKAEEQAKAKAQNKQTRQQQKRILKKDLPLREAPKAPMDVFFEQVANNTTSLASFRLTFEFLAFIISEYHRFIHTPDRQVFMKNRNLKEALRWKSIIGHFSRAFFSESKGRSGDRAVHWREMRPYELLREMNQYTTSGKEDLLQSVKDALEMMLRDFQPLAKFNIILWSNLWNVQFALSATFHPTVGKTETTTHLIIPHLSTPPETEEDRKFFTTTWLQERKRKNARRQTKDQKQLVYPCILFPQGQRTDRQQQRNVSAQTQLRGEQQQQETKAPKSDDQLKQQATRHVQELWTKYNFKPQKSWWRRLLTHAAMWRKKRTIEKKVQDILPRKQERTYAKLIGALEEVADQVRKRSKQLEVTYPNKKKQTQLKDQFIQLYIADAKKKRQQQQNRKTGQSTPRRREKTVAVSTQTRPGGYDVQDLMDSIDLFRSMALDDDVAQTVGPVLMNNSIMHEDEQTKARPCVNADGLSHYSKWNSHLTYCLRDNASDTQRQTFKKLLTAFDTMMSLLRMCFEGTLTNAQGHTIHDLSLKMNRLYIVHEMNNGMCDKYLPEQDGAPPSEAMKKCVEKLHNRANIPISDVVALVRKMKTMYEDEKTRLYNSLVSDFISNAVGAVKRYNSACPSYRKLNTQQAQFMSNKWWFGIVRAPNEKKIQ